MDYAIFTADHTLNETKRINKTILEQMEAEIEFTMACLESSYIDMGNLEILQETFSESVKKIIDSIINFFKRLFGDYRAASEKKMSEYKTWIDKNGEKLANANTKDIDLTVTPYWKGDQYFDTGLNALDAIRESHVVIFTSKSSNIARHDATLNNLADEKTFITTDPKIKALVNKDNNITEGAKNYFRLGNPDDASETVVLTGNELTKKIVLMRQYCGDYDSTIVKRLDDDAKRIETSIKKIQNQLKITTESLLSELTVLRNCINYDILQEATAPVITPAANQPTANATPAPTATPTTTAPKAATPTTPAKPVATDKTNKEEVSAHKEDSEVSKYTHKQLQALNVLFGILKKVISAAMAACEEKFVHYFTAMKVVMEKQVKEPTKEEAKPEEKKAEAPAAKAFSETPTPAPAK